MSVGTQLPAAIRRETMKRLLALLTITFSVCATGALAQQKRPMTFEDVLALKSVSDAQVSPDGKWIAYVVTSVDMKENANDSDVWLVSTAGGEPEKLTDSKSGVQSFQWSPDGNRIAYVALQEPTPEEEKKQKDKDDAQIIDKNFKLGRIWVIDVTTKKAAELVKGEYNASDPQWSPDGRMIAFVTNPTPKADDGSMSDIWVIDVTGAASVEAVALQKKL